MRLKHRLPWALFGLSLFAGGCSRYGFGRQGGAGDGDAAGLDRGISGFDSANADRSISERGRLEDSRADYSPTSVDLLAIEEDSREDQQPIADLTADSFCSTCPVEISLGPSESTLEIAAYLASHGVPPKSAVHLIVPGGIVIGSRSPTSAALVSGDLSAYGKIMLQVDGEIQGAGGAANGGAGGPAIILSSNVTITIGPQGAVRGGGGGGGRGGHGGQGSSTTSSWISRTASVFGADQIEVAWYRSPDNTNCGVRDYPDN